MKSCLEEMSDEELLRMRDAIDQLITIRVEYDKVERNAAEKRRLADLQTRTDPA